MKYQISYQHTICDYHGGKWESKIVITEDGAEVATIALYADKKIHTPVLQSVCREVCDLLRGANQEALEA